MSQALELGCGAHPREGMDVHHDKIAHAGYIDVAWDLDVLPWPWDDEEFNFIWAIDVMEHLKVDVDVWLSECWRILVPGGLLQMRLPAWDNPLSYRDPTHERVFHEESFYYWDPRTTLYADFGRYYFPGGRWWNVRDKFREANDLRFTLVKLET